MSIPLFVRRVTTEESQALADALKSSDGRIVRRAQIVRLSARGRKVGEIADILELSPACITHTIHAFNRNGLKALPDKTRPGRPPKADAQYVRCLKKAVSKSPRALGYVFTTWTLARLREHVGRYCNVLMSPQQLSRILRKQGIVYRRPRHSLRHLRDPREYDEKKALLEFLKKSPARRMPGLNCCTSMSVKFTSTRP
jgi:transposase